MIAHSKPCIDETDYQAVREALGVHAGDVVILPTYVCRSVAPEKTSHALQFPV